MKVNPKEEVSSLIRDSKYKYQSKLSDKIKSYNKYEDINQEKEMEYLYPNEFKKNKISVGDNLYKLDKLNNINININGDDNID